MLNLAEQFFQQAAAQPNHPLILGTKDDVCISYAEFSQHVKDYTNQLNHLVEPNMNIGLHCPNGQDYIAFTYAIWACGACVTPIPVELADEEKQQIFQTIHIDAVITLSRFENIFSPLSHADIFPITEQMCLIPIIAQRQAPKELTALNPAFIRFTSGTTGAAKGVVLSHETIFERIHAANQGLQISPNDRVVWLLSMAYHFAVSIVAYLTFGASIILCKNSFGITILKTAKQHQATLMYGSPMHYALMTQDNSGGELVKLRLAVVTTAHLQPAIADAFYQRFGMALNETYGIIEVGLPAINLSHPREKQGSVGNILPSYRLKLATTADGDNSEILLQGPGFLDAYYEPWQSRETILQAHNGWLATGDLGVVDEEDYLTIVGRSKDVISVGGMKFFPQEIETILERHTAIQASCVFAIKDTRLGEIPVCHLVLAQETSESVDDNELKAYCAKHMANYKIPQKFQWVDNLTQTASGKLIRNANKLYQ